jgi:hypothetical protein
MKNQDELLTVVQVLDELGDVSRRTFYRWRELGRAPAGIKLPNGEIRIVTAALVLDRPNKPEFAALYSALVRYALPPGSRQDQRPPDVAKMLRWLE